MANTSLEGQYPPNCTTSWTHHLVTWRLTVLQQSLSHVDAHTAIKLSWWLQHCKSIIWHSVWPSAENCGHWNFLKIVSSPAGQQRWSTLIYILWPWMEVFNVPPCFGHNLRIANRTMPHLSGTRRFMCHKTWPKTVRIEHKWKHSMCPGFAWNI